MNVIFLGGASGIGASCVAVQFGDRWILVDAGVRMDPNADRLPDLSILQGKPLAAIFVTHAHADHIGAIPLVHQAFPTVPIYASRATMLLMEVMLSDALQVMQKRATTDFEVPLYDKTLVASTLHHLRPLPITGTVTVSELPNVVIHTSRAGHVAGAISIGFDAPDGRLLISGDVSITPQHTVPGAQLSSLQHPDLFILESTYGARLHPNRQAEEERLALAVAEGIERGGHVLIPAFALGRAQEVIRILHMAQRRGSIPEFPIWIDGLVRTVCSTYTAIPDALTTALQRQIHKGYPPFFSGMVRSVMDVRHRERLIQGSPSCIVSSSGMLTGGPSVFYAAHIAETLQGSILITGYQDEESPGRRLLALAEQQSRTLELSGQPVNVRCHFDRYHLSAHADGNELTAMVSAIKPRRVALVHGDPESRAALAQRMERLAEVILPADGQTIEVIGSERKAKPERHATQLHHRGLESESLQPATTEPPCNLETLWRAVGDGSGNQLVSIRELALAWYGETAGEAEEARVQQTVDQACQDTPAGQIYFIPVPELPGFYRVRAPELTEETDQGQARAVQPGALLLIQVYGDKILPAVCFDVRADTVWAYPPTSESNRTRFPRTFILEVIGPWETYPITDIAASRQTLTDMLKATQRWQRQHPPRTLAEQMKAEQSYSLDDSAALLALEPGDLVGRLATAILLNDTPRLFVRQQSGETTIVRRETRYMLHAEWQTALTEGAGDVRPDQMWILSVIDQHLGNAPDLYRRSINPDTGEVTLSFHFPNVARERYKEALTAAAEEAGVTIIVAQQPNQSALTEVAHSMLPPGLTATKTSLHHDRETIRLKCTGTTSKTDLLAAITRFREQTGWILEIEQEAQPAAHTLRPSASNGHPSSSPLSAGNRLDLHTAMALIRAALSSDTSFYKVSANQDQGTLVVRFHFPDALKDRHTETLTRLAAQTGWLITVYPEPHQGAIEAMVRRLIPPDMEVIGAPSLYRKNRQVVVKVRGTADEPALDAAKESFASTTGWTLLLQPG